MDSRSPRDDYFFYMSHDAAARGDVEQLRRLLEAGAEVDSRDSSGRTPLYRAVEGGHRAVVELLIDAGADVEAGETLGYTPLHRAAFEPNRADIAELLLLAGADVNRPDNMGRTPLHFAKKRGNAEVADLLREYGGVAAGGGGCGCLPASLALVGCHSLPLFIVLLLAAFAGGALSSLLLRGGVSAPDVAGDHLSADVVDARQFCLLDDGGHVRGMIACAADGSPSLIFSDNQGNALTVITAGASGNQAIALRDRDGTERLRFGVAPDGSPGVLLLNEQGEPSVALAAPRDGAAGVDIMDSEGELRLRLAMHPGSGPRLTLFDSEGGGRAGLDVVSDGTPAVTLADAAGTTRVEIVVHPDIGPVLAFADAEGTGIWGAPPSSGASQGARR